MTSPFVPDLQEIRRVPAGVALRLARHPEDRELLVLRGRAWITLSQPGRHACQVAPLGDHFIAAGQRLRLPVDSVCVVEACGASGEAIAFGWQPLAAQQMRRDIWAAQVVMPWGELCSAIRAVAGSLQRLMRGLVTCAMNAHRS